MIRVKMLTDRGVMQRLRNWFEGMHATCAPSLSLFQRSEDGRRIAAAMFNESGQGSYWTWQEMSESEYEAARANGRVEER